MNKYNLAEILRRLRGRTGKVELPEIEDRKSTRVSYLRILRSMLRSIQSRGRRASGEEDIELLRLLTADLVGTADAMVERVLRLEADRHTATFMKGAKRALGVDLSSVIFDSDINEYFQIAAARNAGLIKNLSDDAIHRIQQTVTSAIIEGTSNRELQKRLTKEFGISDRRAQLIATDQVAKLNADLNRIRHEQAGITEYVWSTSRDERVRPRHAALEGKVYKYGKPTGAEGGLPPGQPIRCRCVARAVVEF